MASKIEIARIEHGCGAGQALQYRRLEIVDHDFGRHAAEGREAGSDITEDIDEIRRRFVKETEGAIRPHNQLRSYCHRCEFHCRRRGAYSGMRAELESVDQRVAKIESALQQLASVLVVTARQDERLIAIERRVDRLEEAPVRR
jgi:hypothetical protein